MKLHRTSLALAVVAFAVMAGSAVVSANDILTSKTGMTIYTYDKDSAGKSNCNGPCLAVWPAVPAADAPSADHDFGSIDRADGIKQLTFKNKPVYYYIQDRKAGDANGDNVGGVWHAIAKRESGASWKKNSHDDDGYSYSNSY